MNVKDIRYKLHKLQYQLNGKASKNKLTGMYRIKVAYMLMWMRMIPIDKNTLKGWSMPDMNTVSEFRKLGKERFEKEGKRK